MDYQEPQAYEVAPAVSQEDGAFYRSFTVAGGPIRTQHFQSEPNTFNQRHSFTSLIVDTTDHGTWALYNLSPNSKNNISYGFGYVAKKAKFTLAGVDIEAAITVGLATGYQSFPAPIVGGHLRAALYETEAFGGTLNVGLEVSATPYIGETDKGKLYPGIVGTTPYLSVRYSYGNKR